MDFAFRGGGVAQMPTRRCRPDATNGRAANRNGIESSSPGLPAAGYPGNTPPKNASTLKGLNHRTNDAVIPTAAAIPKYGVAG